MTAPPPARQKLTDLLAQAIGDPGSLLPRHDYTETVARWATRAVLHILDTDAAVETTGRFLRVPAAPDGLVVQPVVRFIVRCSQCGTPAPGYEFDDPALWEHDDLTKLGDYHLQDKDWHPDDTGADPEFEGRRLVCPTCWAAGWCDLCEDDIHAWQPYGTNDADEGWHTACKVNADEIGALTQALDTNTDTGRATLAELAKLNPAHPDTAQRLAAIRAAFPVEVQP